MVFRSSIEGRGGVGELKWHCSLNDPEQISLSQRQPAPKPFGIKLGHTQREKEGQTGGERREEKQMRKEKDMEKKNKQRKKRVEERPTVNFSPL